MFDVGEPVDGMSLRSSGCGGVSLAWKYWWGWWRMTERFLRHRSGLGEGRRPGCGLELLAGGDRRSSGLVDW